MLPLEFRRGPGDLEDLQHHGAPEPGQALVPRRPFIPLTTPFRTPASSAAAPSPTPGEVSLAHHGVLFLDELPGFRGLRPRGAEATPGRRQGHHLPGGRLPDLSGPVHAGGGYEPLPLRLPGGRQTGLHLHPQPDQLVSLPDFRAAPGPDRHPGPGAGGAVSGYDGAGIGRGLMPSSPVIAAREIQGERFHKTRIYANAHMPPKLVKQHCARAPRPNAC